MNPESSKRDSQGLLAESIEFLLRKTIYLRSIIILSSYEHLQYCLLCCMDVKHDLLHKGRNAG